MDFLLYGGIAVAFLAAVAFFAFHTGSEDAVREAFKWLGFGAVTAIVFVEAIRRNRRLWGKRRFWLVLCSFGFVQCTLGTVALWRIGSVPTVYWALLLPFNFIALDKYMSVFLDSDRR
jgi:hypothetical protein